MENYRKEGTINIVIGCMFSGKTSHLLSLEKKWLAVGKKVLCINYEKDNRYNDDNNYMFTHNLNKTLCVPVVNLADVSEKIVLESDIILINEGQFFNDLYKFCRYWCDDLKKNITVSGLDGDFKRNKFGEILDLIPICNTIKKLTAFCSICTNKNDNPKDALFTYRLSNEVEQEVIGNNNYVSLCRYHYLENTNIN